MLSFISSPVFAGSWDHRPAVPSPLSSSPLRASSPLSPANENTLSQRQTQSSPVQPSKSKYALRPAQPNPVLRRREDVQETRRKNFLQKVRQKSDDKAWQRRDIEGQFLRTSWLDNLAHLSHDAPAFSETDIDDAMAFDPGPAELQDDDSIMMNDNGEEGLEAMVASYEEQQSSFEQRPPSPTLSDEEYDDILAEFLAQEQRQQPHPEHCESQMDITDNMDMQS